MKGKIASAIYGLTAYAVGMASLVYIGLWLINLFVPNALDAPAQADAATGLAINLVLVIAFGLQHSGMARPGFKRAITRFIPAHLERSTYVLVSGIATVGLCHLWQPLGGVIWSIHSEAGLVAIYTVYTLGWALLVMSTFWINHFDLFGLRQVWLNIRGVTYTHLTFQTPGLYKFIRHPLYVGWFTVMWAAPTMTISHLMFALMVSVYIFMAIQWEEADLTKALPEYRRYKATTPMLVPGMGATARSQEPSAPEMDNQAA